MSSIDKPTIFYRQLDVTDLLGLKAISEACFPTSDFPDEWYCELLTDKSSYAHGAFDQDTGEMVGMIVGKTQCVLEAEDEVNDLLLGSVTAGRDNIVYIPIFGVFSSYRRFHIGSSLMKKFLFHVRTSRHTKAVYLHVESRNVPAITFYEKMGFCYFKTIHGYYFDEGINDHGLIYIIYINDGMPYMGGARDILFPGHIEVTGDHNEGQQPQKLKNSSKFKRSVSIGVPHEPMQCQIHR